MALRNIVQEGEPILRRTAREVVAFDARLHVLLDDMLETMRKANGVGLAAPQVGISRRIVVIEPEEGDVTEMINPVISDAEGEQIGSEGCLSIDSSKNGKVKRPMSLTITYFDRNGVKHTEHVEGFKAVVICHECDHLEGILFIDKVIKEKKK